MKRKKVFLIFTLCFLSLALSSCSKNTEEEVKGASITNNTVIEEPVITEAYKEPITEETKEQKETDVVPEKTEEILDKNIEEEIKDADATDNLATIEYEIVEAYKYPIVPDTEEWKNLGSMPEKIEATYVDPQILSKMSTPALVETVVTYPLFGCVNAYDTLDAGIKEVSEYFKGIDELYSRDDAREEILNYINARCPGLVEMRTEEEISAALDKYMKAYNETGDREVFYIDNAVTLINYLDGNYRGSPDFKGKSYNVSDMDNEEKIEKIIYTVESNNDVKISPLDTYDMADISGEKRFLVVTFVCEGNKGFAILDKDDDEVIICTLNSSVEFVHEKPMMLVSLFDYIVIDEESDSAVSLVSGNSYVFSDLQKELQERKDTDE